MTWPLKGGVVFYFIELKGGNSRRHNLFDDIAPEKHPASKFHRPQNRQLRIDLAFVEHQFCNVTVLGRIERTLFSNALGFVNTCGMIDGAEWLKC